MEASRRSKARIWAPALAFACMVLVAGCGGGTDPNDGGPVETTALPWETSTSAARSTTVDDVETEPEPASQALLNEQVSIPDPRYPATWDFELYPGPCDDVETLNALEKSYGNCLHFTATETSDQYEGQAVSSIQDITNNGDGTFVLMFGDGGRGPKSIGAEGEGSSIELLRIVADPECTDTGGYCTWGGEFADPIDINHTGDTEQISMTLNIDGSYFVGSTRKAIAPEQALIAAYRYTGGAGAQFLGVWDAMGRPVDAGSEAFARSLVQDDWPVTLP